MGELSLRRRMDPGTGECVHEVKLGDAYLMSSLFTAGENALAELGLQDINSDCISVVVGGLGLGYTAHAVLQNKRVNSLLVVEAMPQVIAWHRNGLVPLGSTIVSDSRCLLVEGDFFAMARDKSGGFDPRNPEAKVHAILVDIDHSPDNVLDESHIDLYRASGLSRLADRLYPGGVFALWSNDPPQAHFMKELRQSFAKTTAHIVSFPSPLRGGNETNTIYLVQKDL
ncbi:MAG: spermidine synthase [Ferrovibrio sp.]|uniref:spermidine synthase n=1 Tax=Ferrovibrio sp. TaxID=1917215 RepID=UPI00391D226B